MIAAEGASTILAKLFFTARFAWKICVIAAPTREFNNNIVNSRVTKPNESSKRSRWLRIKGLIIWGEKLRLQKIRRGGRTRNLRKNLSKTLQNAKFKILFSKLIRIKVRQIIFAIKIYTIFISQFKRKSNRESLAVKMSTIVPKRQTWVTLIQNLKTKLGSLKRDWTSVVDSPIVKTLDLNWSLTYPKIG